MFSLERLASRLHSSSLYSFALPVNLSFNPQSKKNMAENKETKPQAALPPSTPAAGGSKKWMLVVVGITVIQMSALGVVGVFLNKTWKKMQWLHAEMVELTRRRELSSTNYTGQEFTPKKVGILYPMDSFLVNIPSDQGQKFLQTQMEFELEDTGVEEELANKRAMIRDAVIVLLTSRSYKDLKDPLGMKNLRNDITTTVNNLLRTGKIREVYFTQFHFN